MKSQTSFVWGGVLLAALSNFPVHASSGKEAASFLDIPVGAAPAALGSAYSALATNVYGSVWNPAGLAFAHDTQIAAQHLSYLESINHEFAAIAMPIDDHRTLAVSVQYLGSGDIVGRNDSGLETGDYSSHYAAYNLSYGHSFGRLSAGATGKVIEAKIADVTARAYAFDAGVLWKPTSHWQLAWTLNHLGTPLKFIHQKDPLPFQSHIGLAWLPSPSWKISTEGVYDRTKELNGRAGIEWKPFSALAIRTGYRSDTVEKLNALAGFSTGAGITVWEQEFAYAWVPYGPLGSTQYFSLTLRFGSASDDSAAIHPNYFNTEEIDHVSLLPN